MNSQVSDWMTRYAGWGLILLWVAAALTALRASNITMPLVLIAVAGTLTVVHYRSNLKDFDFWAFDEWVRTRYDAYGIAEWHAPYHAAELYCRHDIVQARNEAAGRMNSIMMELLKDRSHASVLHAEYDDAQARYNQCNTALGRELLAYLKRGDLFAKGMLSKDGEGKAERIIPTARWRVMDPDISKSTASGAGWHYVGIVVGKSKKPQRKQNDKS
ncbi:MAG: hypothetical protein WCC36_07785 [Gammaproteobacteria bacterium]